MAPSSGDIYKNYFNDPTLSDLTIRLGGRKLYVHRIVLCRRSRYFEKLILSGFKVSKSRATLLVDSNSPSLQESSLEEIPLHGDDPMVMMALFRYIYDLRYEHLNKDPEEKWQFLANVYVAADKYQVEGLHRDVTERMKDWLWEREDSESSGLAEDFMAAVKIVFDNTTNQDKIGRPAMVDFCVCCIRDLNRLPEFKMLLNEYDDLGAEILAHERLSLMLEGTWTCCYEPHRGAIPRCPFCAEPYPLSYARLQRGRTDWVCPDCAMKSPPICTESHGTSRCEWVPLEKLQS